MLHVDIMKVCALSLRCVTYSLCYSDVAVVVFFAVLVHDSIGAVIVIATIVPKSTRAVFGSMTADIGKKHQRYQLCYMLCSLLL